MIEFVPQVGDFVAADEPLFVLHGGAMAIDDRAVRSAVAFGPERTLEQDPMFAFRIIVDIALKALSAGRSTIRRLPCSRSTRSTGCCARGQAKAARRGSRRR
jgi:hypothetical protein